MAIGPVQLLVLGFPEPNFHGQVVAELERLRENDTVYVIDALAVHKDTDGSIEVLHLSNITDEEAVELGTKIGALIGLGIEGEDGMAAGAVLGAEAATETAAEGGGRIFSDDDAWNVLDEIPNGSAAALILLEHRWAIPLRDAIAAAGGYRVGDAFISPLDLVEVGLATADEARRLHDQEMAATVRS
jgi:uncharacterized membrane protein